MVRVLQKNRTCVFKDSSAVRGQVNIDEEPQLAEEEKVQVVPTLIFYKDGKAVASMEAPDSKAKIEAFIGEIYG